ncbi:transglutaminase domain-containing protein [Chitinophaga sp. 22536]|uniref:transglutaminase domain-containing protein n=1 Tax=unclassified Chitinophaga TaxID=2619133 RepID=UPI003F84B2AE
MNCKSGLLTFIIGCLYAITTLAQDGAKIKYGKVSKEDFTVPPVAGDSGAHAIVLARIGSSRFESDGSWFRMVYKVHARIKIIDKNAYDLATVKITLHKGSSEEEKVQNLKASAYNLENGEVVETKMDSKNVFTDKQDKNIAVKKFAIPAVKEGTIIEYTYTVLSPYYQHLRSWDFQGPYPVRYSEYSVGIPEYFDYIQIPQGYEKFVFSKEQSRTTLTFRSEASNGYGGSAGSPSEVTTVTPSVMIYKWYLQNVPAMREEDFITTTDNYVNRIEFQLASINWPNRPPQPITNTWPKLMEELMKDENFGSALGNNNGFLGDVVDGLVKDAKTDEEKANAIYHWVRSNFTCTDHSGVWIFRTLKSIFNSKNGTVAEVNLLLVAMLKRAKLDARPVILSTRDNGHIYPFYPLLARFNYTIAGVRLDDRFVSLDASDPLLGFARLSPNCYNGPARIVDEGATGVSFEADSLREQKFTSVMLGKIENGMIEGSFQQRPTYFESYKVRKTVKEKNQEEFFDNIRKGFVGEVELANKEIEDLKTLESPVMVKFDFKIRLDNDQLIYINPMFTEANRSNIFKSAERKFPVEMNAVFDEIYSLNMELPEGYEIDELPKPAIAKYNEEEGIFQYLIQQQDNHIQLRSRVKLNKANFAPEDYPSLREFFDLVVKKQAEQIVLKKKK